MAPVRHLLASLLVVGGAVATVPSPVAAACGDAPVPGVNWSSCSFQFSELSDVNLSNANLSRADLSYSVLFRANLSGADLRSTNLKDAFPVGANLSGVDARNANFTDADLVAANLTNADLRGANLNGADLDLSAVSGANFVAADLRGADFAQTAGADRAIFLAPPAAANDLTVVEAGKTVTLRVLANDDPTNVNPRATTTIEFVKAPTSGSFNLTTGVYKPKSGFSGVESFSYRPVDTISLKNAPANAATKVSGQTATVTVRVVRRVVLKAPYAGASGQGGEIVRLYLAVFNREPDKAGFDYWLGRYQNGESLVSIAAAFQGTSEFLGDTGALSDRDFVTLMYHNVFIRNPDKAGLDFWLKELQGGMSRARLVVLFANGPEFKAFTGTR